MSLFRSLVTGLQDAERDRTVGMIADQTARARADAAVGRVQRQVDKGTRGRRHDGVQPRPRSGAVRRPTA